MRSFDLGKEVLGVVTRGKQSPGTEVRIVNRAGNTITVAVGKAMARTISGGIVTPMPACRKCGKSASTWLHALDCCRGRGH